MADLNLDQAAKLLGLTPQRLQEMAGTGDIHATKSGDSYSFTQEEVERFADMNGITPGSGDREEYGLADDGDADSVLVDETPVSTSAGGSGHIIGAEGGASPHDSDLKLSDSLELDLDDSDELSLDMGDGDVDQEDKTQFAAGGEFSFDQIDELSLDLDDQGEIEADDKTHFAVGADALNVNTEDELSLDLGGGAEDETQFAIGDSADFNVGADDLVLGGDENLIAGGAESGISLEGAVDLAGDSSLSLELPDAGDVQADEEFMLGGTPDNDMSDSGSQVIAISDSAAFGDDAATMVSPDGSADPFAQPAADPFAAQPETDPFGVQPAADPFGAQPATDPFGVQPAADPFGAAAVDPFGAPMGTPQGFEDANAEQPVMESDMLVGEGVLAAPQMQESSYGFFNVISLFMIFMVQLAVMFLMIDVVRNIWSQHDETPSQVSSTVMDIFLEHKTGGTFKDQPWMYPSIAFGVFFVIIIVGWILDRGKRK